MENYEKLLEIKYLQNFIEANPLPATKPYFPDINNPLNQEKSKAYQELLDFLNFKDYTENALKELKQNLNETHCLENSNIRNWTLKHLEIFKSNILSFGLIYLDSGDDIGGNLHLPYLHEYVDKTPFLSIIKFWGMYVVIVFWGVLP